MSEQPLYDTVARRDPGKPGIQMYLTTESGVGTRKLHYMDEPADYPKRIVDWDAKTRKPVYYAGFPSKWVRLTYSNISPEKLRKYLPQDTPPNWAVPLVRGSILRRWRHHDNQKPKPAQ